MSCLFYSADMSDHSAQVGPPRLIDFSCQIREPDSGSAACQLTFQVKDKKLEAFSNNSSTFN